MKKIKLILAIALCAASQLAEAGGLMTNTNQNIVFLRNPARDGAIGIDGVYSNPAGVAFLDKGFHFSLNIQSAYQTRTATSTFAPFAMGINNNGATTKEYEGKVAAPVIPSFQLAYNLDKLSLQASFAITGGGGKCEFEEGLGSFEAQAALLPLMGKALNIDGYSLDAYMKGRQYFFGLQLGAAYKFTDNFSGYAGLRINYADCNYYGYVKDIMIRQNNNIIPASATFEALYEQALLAIQADPANAAAYQAQAVKMKTLAVATSDVTLNCDQTDWGFTPIIGFDYKFNKFNIGIKYEFETKIRLENKAANSESAKNLVALKNYMDGVSVEANIPALLAAGVQYDITDKARIMLGYHLFFDKQAKQANDHQKTLEHNVWEILAGVEYDITENLTASVGLQNTNNGITDEYLSDMSFTSSSNSLGFGLSYNINSNIRLNLAYFQTFYQTYDKHVDDYNKVSNTVALADPNAATALVQSGALKGCDSFHRTNKVFGIGIDFKF